MCEIAQFLWKFGGVDLGCHIIEAFGCTFARRFLSQCLPCYSTDSYFSISSTECSTRQLIRSYLKRKALGPSQSCKTCRQVIQSCPQVSAQLASLPALADVSFL
ncbi:hypothetical protein Plhal304r1_c045g0125871 [Plasmopara halstedii]